jgi:hypothetical protein
VTPGAPRTPTDEPSCTTSCLVIQKFNDLNANGVYDPGEPMLPGVRFDVQANNLIYPATTDENGTVRMCFGVGTRVNIDELARASGGLWQLTTDEDRMGVVLPCGVTTVWIGNAMLSLPKTGGGGGWPMTPAGTARLY